MPGVTYLPSRESELIGFSQVFSAKISAAPEVYGLTPAQTSGFTALLTAFISAWERVQDPDARTRPNTCAKNAAKQALINDPCGVRELVAIIKSHPGITNAQRAELQLTAPDDEPSPIDLDHEPPALSVLSVRGRSIRARLKDQHHPTRRAKPKEAQGATVLYHVGETASSDPAKWAFALNTSRTSFDVHIPATIPPGSRIWLTAFWFNERKDPGPSATPQHAFIGDGLAIAA
jgi:hypothetical protein